MSEGFQTIDLSTMTFPSEMHVDYVRVYQRDGEKNIGCSPSNFPTADYIASHTTAYSSACILDFHYMSSQAFLR